MQILTMSKKATKTEEPQQPLYVGDLLLNGTTVLTADTREELAEMVDNIPSNVRYAVGAVGKNPDNGAFTLRLDIMNN